jgi:hypothetical protein
MDYLIRKLFFASVGVFAAAVVWAMCGCAGPCGGSRPVMTMRPDAVDRLEGELFSGAHSAAPLFAPAIELAENPTVPPQPVASIEAYNYRPTWPAVSGADLGEVTVYQEWYNDWQGSNTGWGSQPTGTMTRMFSSVRTGMYVK